MFDKLNVVVLRFYQFCLQILTSVSKHLVSTTVHVWIPPALFIVSVQLACLAPNVILLVSRSLQNNILNYLINEIVLRFIFWCNIIISDITDITLVFDIVNFPWVDDLADNSSIIFKSYAGRFCRDVSSYIHNNT